MKLNPVERFFTNSPLRALSQIYIEARFMRKVARRKDYPLCLEIGCGRGVGARLIAEKFGARKVIATDIDPAQIEKARRGLRPSLENIVEFRVEDAMALDEPDGKFDAAFSFGVIHHAEDWRKAVREIRRVLKAGGEFFFMEPLRPFIKLFEGGIFRAIARHPAGGEFSLSELKETLSAEGFELTGLRSFGSLVAIGGGMKRGAT